MPATLVLLALGLLGSILMFAGDMLLYFTPGAYDMDGTLRPYMRIMRDVPAGRVRLGGVLGPVAAFFYVLGFAGLVLVGWLILKTDFSHQEKLKTLYKKAVTAMAGLIVLVLIAVPKITKRLLSIFLLRGDSSTSFRMNVYHSSWQMFCDNWFLGIGAGNQTFREIYGLYMLTGFDALSTYSVPLEIAVEAGIFALIAFVLFLVLFLTDSFKFLLKNDTNDLTGKVIVSAAILVILGVMTHGMFDTIFFRPQVQFLFWTVLAMSSAVLIEKNTKEA